MSLLGSDMSPTRRPLVDEQDVRGRERERVLVRAQRSTNRDVVQALRLRLQRAPLAAVADEDEARRRRRSASCRAASTTLPEVLLQAHVAGVHDRERLGVPAEPLARRRPLGTGTGADVRPVRQRRRSARPRTPYASSVSRKLSLTTSTRSRVEQRRALEPRRHAGDRTAAADAALRRRLRHQVLHDRHQRHAVAAGDGRRGARAAERRRHGDDDVRPASAAARSARARGTSPRRAPA